MGAYTYLDWAATTPLGEAAARAMEPYLVPGRDNIVFGGNANSLHSSGRAAFKALEEARALIARSLGARRPDEVVFTSGATEADNATLFGVVSALARQAKQQGRRDFVPHVITTAFEHDAILAPSKVLQSRGVEVTLLTPTRQGFIDPASLRAAMRDNTVLVSIMAANNEIGTIQPLEELVSIAHAGGALFHSDMVQALGKCAINLEALGVDAASFSAHKICGPKGVGVLYLRANTPFDPFLLGGGQEAGRRSGTQNVCGAVGFAAACEAACADVEAEAARLRNLRDYLYASLIALPGVRSSVEVAAGSCDHLPTIVNVLVEGFESETLILRLDFSGYCVSGGSACSSHSLAPSHVLNAIGITHDEALGSLRISMGRFTTREDIDGFLIAFNKALNWD
ncbi:MAG: cysteine desulfurase family protein [Eggerthellaceae bacterium]